MSVDEVVNIFSELEQACTIMKEGTTLLAQAEYAKLRTRRDEMRRHECCAIETSAQLQCVESNRIDMNCMRVLEMFEHKRKTRADTDKLCHILEKRLGDLREEVINMKRICLNFGGKRRMMMDGNDRHKRQRHQSRHCTKDEGVFEKRRSGFLTTRPGRQERYREGTKLDEEVVVEDEQMGEGTEMVQDEGEGGEGDGVEGGESDKDGNRGNMCVREHLFNQLKEKIQEGRVLSKLDVINLFHIDGAPDDEFMLPVNLKHPGLGGFLESCKDLNDVEIMVGKLGVKLFADTIIKARKLCAATGENRPMTVGEMREALKRMDDDDDDDGPLYSHSPAPFSNTSILDDVAEGDPASDDLAGRHEEDFDIDTVRDDSDRAVRDPVASEEVKVKGSRESDSNVKETIVKECVIKEDTAGTVKESVVMGSIVKAMKEDIAVGKEPKEEIRQEVTPERKRTESSLCFD